MPNFYVGSKFYVKEIKGKYYVYSIENGDDGKQRHTYIGSLEQIITSYLELGVWGVPPQCGRRDLNPGSPAWEAGIRGAPPKTPTDNNVELKGVRIIDSNLTSSNNSEISVSDLIKFEFALRQKKITDKTIKEYLSCIKRNKKDSNNCIKAWRNFYRLVLNRDPPESLKIKRTKPDLRVPTLEEVRKTLSTVKEYPNLYLFYRLLLESGSRESEALKVLSEYNSQNEMQEVGFSIYILNWTRGQKKSFYLFHVTELKQIKISKAYVDKYVKKLNLTPPKYIRKFTATKMLELGIPSEVVDFIQGRTPSEVLTKHYLDLLTLAKKEYKKYAEWLRQNI
ncbi:integrase [Sulfolobus spindle-shaped virus 7]|uniref:Integrase n=1 Tax=Sulfolobus spindle-shaped virus 7 TaxID=693628 RepID=D1GF58_9VIRU|nr:integrase [Sulfolobus spindle-shaped virus 7]ACZ35760.1 integrase [Sulfolobus spindle-shaped virus 7]